jgi:hypothetical protein
VLTETNIALSGRFGLRTKGAFPHVRGDVRLEGVTGPFVAAASAPAAGAVTAGAVFPAAVPASGARPQVNSAWLPGKAPFSQVVHAQKTVRKHNIYMTRVLVNGGDATGPHRWRVPA